MNKRIAIISGGVAEDDFIKKSINYETYEKIICCDSGMGICRKLGLVPDVILGDFDSASFEDKMFFENRYGILWFSYPPEKDGTDTELAISYVLNNLPNSDIDIFAATGGRIDHLLGNIQLLHMGLSNGVEITILDSRNRIRLLNNGEYIYFKADQFGKYVSFIPFSGDVLGVTLTGFKYPISDYTLTIGNSLGVSNEITEDVAKVAIKNGLLLMIESRD